MMVDRIPKVREPRQGQREAILDCLPIASGGLRLELIDMKGLETRSLSSKGISIKR